MTDIKNGRFIIKTKKDLLEMVNKELVFVINNQPKKLLLKMIKNQIVLYNKDKQITQSHYDRYLNDRGLNDRGLVFTNIISCEDYLQRESLCENIAEALIAFKRTNGHFWKKKLLDSYENGIDTNPSLRRFRNMFELSLLTKIKKDSTVKDIMNLLEYK